jgi:thiamine biosynthesis lipoprotein
MASSWILSALLLAGAFRQEAVEPHMGTLVRIVWEGDAGAARAGFARIAELEAKLSDSRAESEINRACREPGFQLSGDVAALLRVALAVAGETDGAFDPTLAAVTRHGPEPPAEWGWRKVRIEGRRVWTNGTCFDLGGIAKGFAAQEALQAMAARGVRRAMVAIGGDICVGEGTWRIGAQGRAFTLADACISTSGNDSQPGHVFDPRSGRREWRGGSVTVVSRDGARADALATAHFLLSPAGTVVDERPQSR